MKKLFGTITQKKYISIKRESVKKNCWEFAQKYKFKKLVDLGVMTEFIQEFAYKMDVRM